MPNLSRRDTSTHTNTSNTVNYIWIEDELTPNRAYSGECQDAAEQPIREIPDVLYVINDIVDRSITFVTTDNTRVRINIVDLEDIARGAITFRDIRYGDIVRKYLIELLFDTIPRIQSTDDEGGH